MRRVIQVKEETKTYEKWMIRGKVNESGKMKEREVCWEKEKYSRRKMRRK